MLHKTQGIVLTHYKYGESSLVVHIFTHELGMQSYLVNGVWKKNSKFRAALFQPLTILNMEVYFKQNKSMQRIKEVTLQQANHSILGNVSKSTTALFISELLHKSLRIESADSSIYSFLLKSIEKLEEENTNIGFFPIDFMRGYSVVLGIVPQLQERTEDLFFDLLNGKFKAKEPMHPMFFRKEESTLFSRSLFPENKDFKRKERQILTDLWIEYYQIHFESISSLKSIKVLREVFF